jgi:hypothetical protein
VINVEAGGHLRPGRRGWSIAVALVIATLVGTTAVAAAVRAFTIITPSAPATNAFVRQSQLGMGRRSLNQLANAEIRRELGRQHMVTKRTVILSTRIDGDTGTVVAQVSYGRRGGPALDTTELTLIFHRSVWSVEQVTPGAPAQDTN